MRLMSSGVRIYTRSGAGESAVDTTTAVFGPTRRLGSSVVRHTASPGASTSGSPCQGNASGSLPVECQVHTPSAEFTHVPAYGDLRKRALLRLGGVGQASATKGIFAAPGGRAPRRL
jgi:hypothetical protein